jgi:hypothetical protein
VVLQIVNICLLIFLLDAWFILDYCSSPVASARANPRIANENSWGRTAGFRAVDAISDEKIDPIPIPAPVSPIAASPAPMYFAAANIVDCFVFYTLYTAH